ncbi:DUF7507 domain-containing protein [Tamlana crocina]|uniref:DUF11 domain-containing protein n=1 Tax=Tamlana crocina TaxID=393006 RepID=A0ABX1DC32_9FLAO|nr:gliding motility-associated C-terminal domain-containing protein [Tamlana crocina]NJX14654.1 DUF11 domain-containing protein [Tamlana crocina]
MNKTTYTSSLLVKFSKKTKPIIVFMALMFVLSVTSNAIANHKNGAISNFIPPVTVPCNTDLPVPITSLNYSDLSVSTNTTGICVVGCGIADEDNMIDADEANSASVSTLIGLGVTHTIRVTDNTVDEFYTAGSFAGFLIENSSVLQADLLDAVVVRTYLDGVEQESNTSASLAAIGSTLLGADQYYVGFHTTENFDAIEISISSLAGVLSTTNVYHAVTNSFCAGPVLQCNVPTLLAKPDFSARIVEEHTGIGGVLSVGSVIDANNAIDSNANTFASIDFTAGVLATGNLAIKDELVDYPEGTYAGFDIENASVLNLDLLEGVTVTTYLDGVLQESQTGNDELLSVDSGLLFTGTQRWQVGFVSTLPFDEVQLSIQQTLALDLGSTRVYGLVLQSFCEGILECSTATVLNNPSQPVIINSVNTGVDGLACVGCKVGNATHVINENNTDFASINLTAGVANTASIGVKNVLETFPSGSHAGFVIRDTNDLLQVDLLNSLSVTTYLGGEEQESETGSGLLALEALGLVEITPSSTDGFSLVGFRTTTTFDELRLTVGSLVGVVNSIEVYGSYVDKSIIIEGTVGSETAIGASDGTISVSAEGGTPPYSYSWSPGGQSTPSISGLSAGTYSVTVTDAEGCQSTAEFIVYTDGVQYPVPCNTENPVPITHAGFTDLTVTEDTNGIAATGLDNIIDADVTNYAEISTTLGLGVYHTISVTDNTVSEFFESGGYAGFLIENSALLQVDLLNAITVTTYLNGAQQETNTSTSLIALNSPILGSGQSYVGFYTTMDYDEIEISIASLADVLSTTRIYHAVTSSFCPGPDLECNTVTRLTKPNFPVRVVEEHTGTGGLLTLGGVNDINRAIDSNPNNYATIDLLAGVAGTASIAFKDELTDYPATTYAGFDIENASVLSTDLLDAITITTYLDGVQVESKTGTTELVPVDSGLLLTGSQSIRLGFVTTQPFDEVQLSLNQLVSLDLGSTRVYGMVLQTFCPGTINCDEPYVLSNPSDSVIINNDNTGTDGVACVACEVDNAVNAISEDTSDFALINIVAGVAGTASLSVQDVLADYPVGTEAGFVIRDTNNLLQADLLNALTITTYLDGVQQEQQTANNLLALEALGLVNITPTTTDSFYVVKFTTTLSFDEVQLTVGSLVGVINSIEVYGAYIDTTNTTFCDQAEIALVKQGVVNDENGDGCTDVGETITYTFILTNQGNISINTIVINDPLLGGNIAAVPTGDNGDNMLGVNETWVYTLNYTITQDDIDAGSVTNQATVAGTSTGGDPVSDSSDDDSITEDDQTVTPLCQEEAIALIKQGSVNTAEPSGCAVENDTIDFVFTVTNEGNTTLTSVSLSDPLLGGAIAAIPTGDDDSDGELDVNETWVYSVPYTITSSDITNAEVINQALVEAIGVSGNPVTDLSDDNSVLEDGSTTVDLCQTPAIAIIKTATLNDADADNCSDASETLTYTFTVTNQGNTGLQNVALTDPMFPNAGDISLDSGDLNTDNILDVGEIWVFTANYTLTQADIDFGSISNQASVSGESSLGVVVSDLSDNDNITEDDTTETTLCQSANIALIKTGVFNDTNGDSCSDVGETITYTFSVTNQGNVSIANVVLDDPLLGGSIALLSGDDDADNELDVTETWIYTSNYTITQTDIDTGSVSNQATVTGISTGGADVSDLSDDDSILEDDITETVLCQSANIALIKTGVLNDTNGDSCSNVGETITYTFTVTNQGNVSIANVVLDDPLLGGSIALLSGDDDTDNELDVTETWIYTSDYSITQADIDTGVVSNQATITGTGVNGLNVSDLSDNDSIIEDENTETALCQSAGIALIKTGIFNDADNDSCSDVGETITYTFTVTNQGNVSIANVVLDDPLLGGALALASGDTDADNELDVTETWIYTSNYTITQSDISIGLVSNQATVTGTSAGGVGVSDLSDDDNIAEDDTTETTLCQSSDIALIKTAIFNDTNNDGCSDVGETITYTFTVTNQGNVSIANVVLDDPLLGGALALASGDTDADNELDVTETWIYTSDYTITQSDINMGLVSNQAVVVGTSTLGVDVSDLSDDNSILEDDTTETPLCIPSAISLEKVGVFNDENGSGAVQVGETITYTFTVYNTGKVTLYNINIQDPLPGIVIQGGPIAQLLPGESDSSTFTAVYTVEEGDLFDLTVTNQATVTAEDVLGNPVTDTSDDPNNLEDIDINNDGEPDDQTVINLPGILGANFEIFNGITPDGDGLNDFFLIEGIENYPDNTLKVYNRWGVLVYETEGYGINGKVFRGLSDGRVTVNRNEELPTGTYFYILTRRVTNQDPLTNQGYLYIKRK